jgi:predicted ATPase/Tfp pilus assembly protein PilF
MAMAADLFISYARKDWDRVEPWVRRLQEAGVSVWLDVRAIDGAQYWTREIVDAIESCRVLVLMASTSSLASEQVLREVTLALEGRKRILPLLLEPVSIPSNFRYPLAGLQQIDLSSGDSEAKRLVLLRGLSRLGVHVDVNITGLVVPGHAPSPTTTPAHHGPHHNLPAPLTSFVGRERELAGVQQLLTANRLVTLTGPGGAGKTRMAIQIGTHLLEQHPDGVWLVELDSLTDPDLVPQTTATALGVREEPDRPLTTTLSDYIKQRHLLLILDNCEHVVTACAHLAQALLRASPHLRILATSREALRVPGETPYSVPSLSLPPAALPTRSPIPSAPNVELGTPDAEHPMMQYEAIRLFVERAATAKPGFAVTDQNAPAVAQVCRRLDGIPLALELAAARVRVLSVEQVAQRLDDRFRLLTGGSRTLLPRQQTLRALIDWSYDLLSEPERALLRRLSVFAGGFTLNAAEAVCAGGDVEEFEILDLVTQLTDKSLVVIEEQEGEARYRLLESIREYGDEQLQQAGEGPQVRGQHRDWFLAVAEQAEPELQGPDQAEWLDRLEVEHDNLRAALATAVESGQGEIGLRLGAALWRFWTVRGHLAEGRDQLARLLALPGAQARTDDRARVLNRAGALADDQGDVAAARSLFEESLAIGRELDNSEIIARTLPNLGLLEHNQGNYDAARSLFEESLAVLRQLGDQRGIASSLNNLGRIALQEGDDAAARALFVDSLDIRRQLGDRRGIAVLLNNLGWVAHNQGDLAAARSSYEESLQIWRELGNRPHYALSLLNLGLVSHQQGERQPAIDRFQESLRLFHELGDNAGIAACLKELAAASVTRGDWERAARMFGAAEALRDSTGNPIPAANVADYEQHVAAVREGLGEEVFADSWSSGRAMAVQQAVAYAVQGGGEDGHREE